jgi:hypothetical protein
MTRVTRCLVKLFGCKNANTFGKLKRKPLSQRIQMIREATEAVTNESSLCEEVRELNNTCGMAESLSKWRNERIPKCVSINTSRC